MASTTTQRNSHKPPSGILGRLPPPWVPYLELARVNKPHGLFIGLFSHTLGILYAVVVSRSSKQTLSLHAGIIGRLFLWLILCRSAGCAWNDVVDQDYDRKTTRCRDRPIARGALTTANGCWLASGLVILAFLPLLSLSGGCIKLAFVAVALTALYPFAKRVTNFPQVVLGVIAGVTVTLAAYAANVDAFSVPLATPTLCLMSTIVLHLVFYDLLYSRADATDDMNSGVKSMAVFCRDYIPLVLGGLALGATTLTFALGMMVDFGTGYFVLAVGGQILGLGSLAIFTLLRREAEVNKFGGWCFLVAFGSLLVAFAVQM